MSDAVDGFLVGTRLAESLDQGFGHLQRRQGAVVVKRNRMVDAQREDHLGLHIDAFLVDAGVDEDGCQLIAVAAFQRFLDQQGDRLAAPVAQLQRWNDHVAGLLRTQGDQPAGDCARLAIAAGELIDLAGVENLEQVIQRLQVGLAEHRAALAFQA